jgi:hypothetical protein
MKLDIQAAGIDFCERSISRKLPSWSLLLKAVK